MIMEPLKPRCPVIHFYMPAAVYKQRHSRFCYRDWPLSALSQAFRGILIFRGIPEVRLPFVTLFREPKRPEFLHRHPNNGIIGKRVVTKIDALLSRQRHFKDHVFFSCGKAKRGAGAVAIPCLRRRGKGVHGLMSQPLATLRPQTGARLGMT